MGEAKENICTGGPTLIFACSGAADVGALSDLAARKLTTDGVGKMYCLAGIGGRVKGIMQTTQNAAHILAIDGCALDCVKLCLDEAGFVEFDHIRVTDCGLEKGQSPATNENITSVVRGARKKLGA
ncbi:MAG: putative zinc-binding protein [Candidatus Aminicenantes bacterium]|nr:MAG: putative zinc-binding protein [Candidatus Aminicenantes bacterium]